MKSYLNTKKQTGVGEKLHLPDCLLACSFGERNKFTIENLNSSRSALADKFGSIFCDRIDNVYFACPKHKTSCPKRDNHNKRVIYKLHISF